MKKKAGKCSHIFRQFRLNFNSVLVKIAESFV